MFKKTIRFIILMTNIIFSLLPFYKSIEITESTGYYGGEVISYSTLFSELKHDVTFIILPLLLIIQLLFVEGKMKLISFIVTSVLFVYFLIIITINHPFYIGIAPYLFLFEQIIIFIYLKKNVLILCKRKFTGKMQIKIILLTFLTLLYSCDITENRFITIKNNSNKTIHCYVSTEDTNSKNYNENEDLAIDIHKNDYNSINPVRVFWEDYLNKCKNGKLRLYIIKKDSVEKYGWQKINEKEIYNKKYKLDIQDLEKINWEIIFEQ
jgi:hypothetical protein